MALFGRKPRPEVEYPRTGSPFDDETMKQLAVQGVDFDMPRDWVHYIYCDTVEDADSIALVAGAAGWTVRHAAASPGIIASRDDMPVNGQTVPEVRGFFEGLASRVKGGEYDGWEAAV